MSKFTIVLLLVALVAMTIAKPQDGFREKRDVMDSVKNAQEEASKALSDAGDAVVNVFKPTEKSVADKLADGIKNI